MWKRGTIGLFVLALMAVGGGCGSPDEKDEIQPRFVSDDPGLRRSSFGSSGGFSDADCEPLREERTREATLVGIEDNRVYALSRSGGLSVIETGGGDDLRVLGRSRPEEGTPFGLYARGDRALAMYTNIGRPPAGEERASHEWIRASRLLSLDASDPNDILATDSVDIAGTILDSQINGSILYITAYQSGSCWECTPMPGLVLSSFDVSSPRSIRKVDELTFPSQKSELYGWQKPALIFAKERAYVVTRDNPDNEEPSSSTIRVVEIEESSGKLALGGSTSLSGMISGRSQMSEHEGVLRILTSPERLLQETNAKLQTFSVESSAEIRSLDSLELPITRWRDLGPMRFDGTRGYATTTSFDRGSLYFIDASNPEHLEMKSELAMEGQIHHIEPRGDRLYVLSGYSGSDAGRLYLASVDVSDLSKPKLVDRVYFGESRDWLPEAENQARGGLPVLPEMGLGVVPYGGFDSQLSVCDVFSSKLQLIGFEDGDFIKHSEITRHDQPRFGFLMGDALTVLNGRRAELFDITDRSKPKTKAKVRLGHQAEHLLVVGEHIVRIGPDWETGKLMLEVTPADEPNTLEPLGRLNLDDPLELSSFCSDWAHRRLRLFAFGSHIYIVLPPSSPPPSPLTANARVLVVNIENPSEPQLVHKASYPVGYIASDDTGQRSDGSFVQSGQGAIQVDSTLIMLTSAYVHRDDRPIRYDDPDAREDAIQFLDLSRPEEPRLATLRLPLAERRTGLQLHGRTILLSSYTRASDEPSKVIFNIERVDLSNLSEPSLLPSMNAPGSLVGYDASTGRYLTVEYRHQVIELSDKADCERDYGNAYYDRHGPRCTQIQRSLSLLEAKDGGLDRIHTLPLPNEFRISRVAQVGERLYLQHALAPYEGLREDCSPSRGNRFEVVNGMRSGGLRMSSYSLKELFSVDRFIPFGGGRILVSDNRQGNIAALDGEDPTLATVIGNLRGNADGVGFDSERAYFALGEDGIQTFHLPSEAATK